MAKTFNYLFDEITSFENLWRAWKSAAKGKRNKIEVATFEMDADKYILQLQAALRNGSYKPDAYCSFEIQDPKRRLVSAAPFADRVVHHALVQVIESLFERTFIGDSYANRVGKGTHAALDAAQRYIARYPYALQCDLKQFFPSIDHALLLQVIERKITCRPTRALCATILASGVGLLDDEYDMVYFGADDLLAAQRPRGLPIGNLTSQFWANVYLNELDQFVKRELQCAAYVRYVDDFLLFAAQKPILWQWRTQLVCKLGVLRLKMHERKSTLICTKQGVPFLGMLLFSTHRRLKSRNAWAFASRLRKGEIAVSSGLLSRAKLTARVQGWVAHAAKANTKGLRQAIFE